MRLLEELRLAREVNREAGEAYQAEVKAEAHTRRIISGRNIAVLLPLFGAGWALVLGIGIALGPNGETWLQAAPFVLIWGFILAPAEYRRAFLAQRAHRLGSAARTAILTWAVSWAALALMIWLVAYIACAELSQLPKYSDLWPRAVVTTTIECVGLVAITLTARIAGALVAERTERKLGAQQ